MKNRKLRLGLSVVAFGAMGLAWACSDTNSGTGSSGTGGAANGGNTDTGTNNTTGTSTSTSSGTGDTCTAPQTALSGVTFGPTIDDMTGQQSETGGSWYTYSDRSVPNSEPPIILTPAPAGSVTPTEGASFPPVATCPSGDSLMIGGMAVGYREAVGGGENDWGAGFGMDLTSATPDGGAVAFNMCGDAGTIFDTNPDAGSVGIPQPFNASAYSGFSFWGISLSGNASVNVQVDDSQTSPWGGACNVCLNGGKCPNKGDGGPMATEGCPCSDNFIETFTFLPNKWTQYQVKWTDASFKVSNWSTEGASLKFDPSTMYNIHFQFTTSSGKALPNFDVAVAYIQWTM